MKFSKLKDIFTPQKKTEVKRFELLNQKSLGTRGAQMIVEEPETTNFLKVPETSKTNDSYYFTFHNPKDEETPSAVDSKEPRSLS